MIVYWNDTPVFTPVTYAQWYSVRERSETMEAELYNLYHIVICKPEKREGKKTRKISSANDSSVATIT